MMIAVPPPASPPTEERPHRLSGAALHVVGGVITAAATAVAFVATLAAALNSTYCANTPPAGAQATLTVTNAIITIVWVAVPSLWIYLTARRHLRWMPWLIIASVGATIGICITVTAAPMRFCLF